MNYIKIILIMCCVLITGTAYAASPFDRISEGSDEYRALSVLANAGVAKKYSEFTIGDYRGKELTRYQFALVLTQLLTKNGEYDANQVISTFEYREQQIAKQLVQLFREELETLGLDVMNLKFLKKDPLENHESPILTVRDKAPEEIKKQQEVLKRKVSRMRFEERSENKLKRVTNNISADTVTNHLFLKDIILDDTAHVYNSTRPEGFNVWDRITFNKVRTFGDNARIETYFQILAHNQESEFSRAYFNEYTKVFYTNPWWDVRFGNGYLDLGSLLHMKFFDGFSVTYKQKNARLKFFGGFNWQNIEEYRYDRKNYGADISDTLYFNRSGSYLTKWDYGFNYIVHNDDTSSINSTVPDASDVTQLTLRSDMAFKNNLNWFLEFGFARDDIERDNYMSTEDNTVISGFRYKHDNVWAQYRYTFTDKDYLKYTEPLIPTMEHYFRLRYRFDYWLKMIGEYRFSADTPNLTPAVNTVVRTVNPVITFEILPSFLWEDLKLISTYRYLDREDDTGIIDYTQNEWALRVEDVIFNSNISLYNDLKRRYNRPQGRHDLIQEIYGGELNCHFSPKSRGMIGYESDSKHKDRKIRTFKTWFASDMNEEYIGELNFSITDHDEYTLIKTDFIRDKIEAVVTRNMHDRRTLKFSFGYEDTKYNDFSAYNYRNYTLGTDYYLKF